VLRAVEDPAHLESEGRTILIGVMALVALLNILAAYIPMREGIRALEKAEF